MVSWPLDSPELQRLLQQLLLCCLLAKEQEAQVGWRGGPGGGEGLPAWGWWVKRGEEGGLEGGGEVGLLA